MTLPVTFSAWRQRQQLCKGWESPPEGFNYSAEDAIRWSAQWLIERLYIPCSVRTHPYGTVVRHPNKLTKPYDVEKEAINWGGLDVVDVESLGEDGWLVSIEEASPDCPALSGYIQDWLSKWGWKNAKVVTEW